MNKKIRSLSVCGAAMFLSLLVSSAFGYEKEIEQLSSEMAGKIASKGKKTVAVVDFTDLEGKVTQLDRMVAEEFSVALAGAGKGFKVIERTYINRIIKEKKLSETGLIDTDTVRKLGKFIAVDALVTGTVTPFGDNMRVTVKILDTETAELIDGLTGNLAKTKAVDELLEKGISSESAGSASAGETKQLSDKKAAMSQVVKDILFEVQECKVSGNALTCRTTATNKKDDMDIRIYSHYDDGKRSRMFDSLSNEQNVSLIEFANKRSSNGYVEHMLVSGVKTRLDFNFENIDNNTNRLALLEIVCNEIASNNVFKVQFRDIPISR